MLRQNHKFHSIWVLLLIAALLAGCSQAVIRDREPFHITLAIDESDSVSEKQRADWLRTGKGLLSSIRGGDRLTIYGIHDRTADSAPLFDETFPSLPAHPAIDQVTRFNAMLKQ